MLDETTYYITAFAVDSNNAVIGTQQTTITTSFGWHPSANTLLYMPLNGNIKDEVSGSYGTAGGTVSYETLSSGLKVFHKVSGNYILTPSITMNTEMTVVGWLYWISGDLFFRADSTSTPRSFYQISVGGTNQGGGYWWNNGTAYGTSSGTGKNGWYHCVLVCGSGGVKIYVNGTLVYSNATTSFSWRSQKRGVGYDQWKSSSENAQGYYSHLIIEKKQWTLNDVIKDYNHTKNLYGIS